MKKLCLILLVMLISFTAISQTKKIIGFGNCDLGMSMIDVPDIFEKHFSELGWTSQYAIGFGKDDPKGKFPVKIGFDFNNKTNGQSIRILSTAGPLDGVISSIYYFENFNNISDGQDKYKTIKEFLIKKHGKPSKTGAFQLQQWDIDKDQSISLSILISNDIGISSLSLIYEDKALNKLKDKYREDEIKIMKASSEDSVVKSTCDGNCENGHGTYSWPDGKKYIGEWKDNKFNGKGTLILPDGKEINGKWKNGIYMYQ